MRQKPILLVVDDDPEVRRLIARILQNNGFDVIEAATAMECLDVLQSHRNAIDLVILDVIMPDMGGLDLAAEVCRLYPDLKVLYISGYGTAIAIQCVAFAAPDLVLLKPFTTEMLLDRVRHLCERD